MSSQGLLLGILFLLVSTGSAKNPVGKSVRGICERCNNIDSAMTGVDVSGTPVVDPQLHNPAIKGIIFQVEQNSTWIDTYKEISCTASFQEHYWNNFTDYVFGATNSHSSGMDLQIGQDTPISYSSGGATIGTTVPPIFSRGTGDNETAKHMESHFKKNQGTVSHSEARCNIYTITLYPKSPDVKLSDNFVNRVKQIDKAQTVREKEDIMRTFIKEFGTHFGKKTTMGVGLKFETRFTEKETKDFSDHIRNACNSINGAELFGIQLEPDTIDCSKTSLSDTEGTNGGVKRFSASSYGSFPHDELSKWQEAVENADANDNLDPLPLEQEYGLILDLFNTSAVAAITHSDETPVNTTRLIETGLYGYERYCYLLEDKPCSSIGCAFSVRLGDMIFNYASRDDYNRAIFEEWTTSSSKKLLFFKDNHWQISDSPSDVENPKFKTADCPMSATTFTRPIIDFEQETSDWWSCSVKCSERDHCNYWEYKIDLNQCIMIEDFFQMSETSEKTFSGTKDCPGSRSLRDSVFGTCVENHPNMWISEGEQYFQKELNIEINEPTSMVISGGYRMGSDLTSVEILGQNDCSWPVTDLPYEIRNHMMEMTPDGTILACGGNKHPKSCLSYNIDQKEWKQHSTMIHQREASSSVTLPSGVYVLGGFDAPHSSEFLPRGSSDWIEGPEIPVATSLSCAVSISKTQFVIIGGGGRYSDVYSHVEMYEASPIFRWNTWPSLKEARKAHGCAKLGNKIIVAGGIGKWGGLKSTEIIDVNTGSVRSGRNMQAARRYFSMATLGGRYQKVLAIGGSKNILGVETDVGTIEEWNDDDGTWAMSPNNLNTPRRRASLVVVPQTRICKI